MKNLVLIFVTFFALSAFAGIGNDHGNGGGVICVNGQCRTLTDSGLAISPQYPDFWIPSEEVLANINGLIARYPFPEDIRTKIRQLVLLKMTHFKAVEVVDPAKLEMIKQFYIDTIRKSSPQFDFTNFKIVAMSSDNSTEEQNTFLLPEFLALPAGEQAKMLIHEGLYRGRPSSDLKFILQLESALKQMEGSIVPQDVVRKSMVTAQIAAYHLNILSKKTALALIIISTYSNISKNYFTYNNATLVLTNQTNIFKLEPSAIDSSNYVLKVNTDCVQSTANLDGRTAVLLLNLNEEIPLTKINSFQYNENLVGYSKEYGFFLQTSFGNFILAEPENLTLLLPK